MTVYEASCNLTPDDTINNVCCILEPRVGLSLRFQYWIGYINMSLSRSYDVQDTIAALQSH